MEHLLASHAFLPGIALGMMEVMHALAELILMSIIHLHANPVQQGLIHPLIMRIALTVDLARFQSQDLDRAHQVVLQVTTLKAEELNVYLVQQDLIMVLLGGHRYLFVSLAVLCNTPYLVLQAVQQLVQQDLMCLQLLHNALYVQLELLTPAQQLRLLLVLLALLVNFQV